MPTNLGVHHSAMHSEAQHHNQTNNFSLTNRITAYENIQSPLSVLLPAPNGERKSDKYA